MALIAIDCHDCCLQALVDLIESSDPEIYDFDLVSNYPRMVHAPRLHAPRLHAPRLHAPWLHAPRMSASRQPAAPSTDILRSSHNIAQAVGVTLFAASQSDSADIEVRSFAPSQGVPEDPVCGSGNGAVAAFRRDVDSVTGLAGYCAAQGRSVGRDGEVRIRYADPDEIWVGGECVVAADGFLNCD